MKNKNKNMKSRRASAGQRLMGGRPDMMEWQRAKDNGDGQRASELVSASYLLASESYVLLDEADDLLGKYGISVGELKLWNERLRRAFDHYFAIYRDLIERGQQTIDYFEDLDALDKAFRAWAWPRGEYEHNPNI